MPPLERTLECDSRTFSHAPGSVCVKRGAVPAASARTAWAAGQLPGGGAQWQEEGVLPFTSPCLALGPHCLLELWNWGLTRWGRGYLRPRTLGAPPQIQKGRREQMQQTRRPQGGVSGRTAGAPSSSSPSPGSGAHICRAPYSMARAGLPQYSLWTRHGPETPPGCTATTPLMRTWAQAHGEHVGESCGPAAHGGHAHTHSLPRHRGPGARTRGTSRLQGAFCLAAGLAQRSQAGEWGQPR